MWTNARYLFFRLVRKFLFSRAMMDRWHHLLPYYRPTAGQYDPAMVLDSCWGYLAEQGVDPRGKTFLELGAGATNGVGYLIAGRSDTPCYCFEPLVPFNASQDQALQQRLGLVGPVVRVRDLAAVPDGVIDVVISVAVLEHVYDMDALLAGLKSKLRPGFCMVHVVDYRDHFFEYPLHFLQFSRETWQRWLDPGNMPRHRLGDHWEAFARHGFTVQVLQRVVDRRTFARIRHRIAPCFHGYHPDDLATTQAVLWVRR